MIDAQDIARRIVEAGAGESTPSALLERVFGREGDSAIAASLAFWALSTLNGEATDAAVEGVASALLTLLKLPS